MIMALLITGCKTFEAKPLVPAEILEQVEASRNLISVVLHDDPSGDLSGPQGPGEEGRLVAVDPSLSEDDFVAETGFARLALWMDGNGPELLRARSEFDQAWAVSEIDTPLPNPELSGGPIFGTKLGPGARHKIQPAIEFGFAIPLNNRLSKNDDVLKAKADESFVNLVVTHRKKYLELRRLYMDWILSERRLAIQEEIRASTRKSLELTRRMIDAGMASALDVGLMELEAIQQEAMQFESEAHCIEIEGTLAKTVGVSIEKVRDAYAAQLPSLDMDIPSLDEAKALMVANHNGLASQRAHYEVTEKELRLAVALQYPDLEFGAGYEGDPGDRKKVWGLSVGIALPLFDRNQQGIAEAEAEREKARIAYTSLLNESLGELEGLYERYAMANRKFALLRDSVLPQSEANLDVALKSIRSGTIDSLKYLEVERTLRSLLIEVIAAEQEIRRLVGDLEQLIGLPLALFPNESSEDFPMLSDGMEENNDASSEDAE